MPAAPARATSWSALSRPRQLAVLISSSCASDIGLHAVGELFGLKPDIRRIDLGPQHLISASQCPAPRISTSGVPGIDTLAGCTRTRLTNPSLSMRARNCRRAARPRLPQWCADGTGTAAAEPAAPTARAECYADRARAFRLQPRAR